MAYTPTLRDKIASSLCNFILTRVATKEYCAFVWGVSRAGVENLLPWMEQHKAWLDEQEKQLQ